ncbi:MAG: thioredoxin family protein [Candidatus Bathyarchaeota archaeon]|nr:thioredoxin family protein [Candidatus Bathyarchaeota archaeon]
MSIVDINAEQLDAYLQQGRVVVLLIWIKRCDQCAKFKPVFQQLPDYYLDVTFLRMNMLESMENLRLAEKYEKEQTPIIPVFCKGDHIGTFIGYYSLDDFMAKFDEIVEENC